MEQKHIIAVVLILAAIFISIYIYTDFGAATIDVQGQGIAKAMPDNVAVYFSIEAKENTAQEAKDKITEIANKVTDALYFAGIDKEKITTQSYNIYPNNVWENNEYKQKGFIARQELKVESSRFDMAGRIIDLGVNNGALVSYINFELSDKKQNELKTEAMKKASEDAKSKAQGIAQGLGKNLGKLISIQTSDFYYPPYRLYEAYVGAGMEQAKAAVTDINPSEIETSASVSAKFKIY